MSAYVTARWLQQLDAAMTPGDEAVLRRVSDLRFVTGAQLACMDYNVEADQVANARAARRGLLRLVRLGALARLPRPIGGRRSGSAGFVYYLSPGGQRLAMARGWQPERPRRRSLVPGQLFVKHSLAVAELHAVLVEGDRSRRFELLELVAEPSCWRSYDGDGYQRVTLKPDSYARLGAEDYEDSYFFEVDRGTEGSRAIERQLDRYLAYYRTGREQAEREVFPTVLWLAPNADRATVIQASIERLGSSEQRLFQTTMQSEVLTAVSGK